MFGAFSPQEMTRPGVQKQRPKLGRIAPNYLADIVAVEGDPLVQIDALFTGVRWVMKDGKVVIDKR